VTYETVREVALNSGLLYFCGFFALVIGYVLWPANRKKFDRAARMPLDENES
jgi:cytochrome c oxidase cbb3-type subunit 4